MDVITNISKEYKMCFLIFIGLPGSGKTTFCSYLIEQLEDTVDITSMPFHCVIHICYDDIINLCHDIQWSEARRIVTRKVADMIENLKCGVDINLFVKEYNLKIYVKNKEMPANPRILLVVDDNMYYRSMRYQYYQIARDHQLSYCQLYFKCHVEECLRRNSQRNVRNQVAPHIILKMAENLEQPNINTHPWEIFSTFVNSDEPFNNICLVPLYQIISDAFAKPVQPVIQKFDGMYGQTCSLNIVHQADLVLRKIIGTTIKDKKKLLNRKQIQELFTSLNDRRQTILQEIKLGKLHLPAEITSENDGNLLLTATLHSSLLKKCVGGLHQFEIQ